MPAAVRLHDICSGHQDWPPRPNIEGSPDTFINGIASHRVGDAWAVHCNPVPQCHDGVAQAGSPDVFVNGKAKMRVGDPVNCGSTCAQGSPDVFVN